MGSSLENDLAIKRYLLGELSDEEQQRLEERLLTDREYFERLQIMEVELVDEYARGALSAGEQERFDIYFLSTPERHQMLRFASALRRYVSAASPARQAEPTQRRHALISAWQSLAASLRVQNPALGYSLSAALLLIVLAGIWSMVRTRQLQNQLEWTRRQETALEQELKRQFDEQRARALQLAQELERERIQRTLLEQARGSPLPSNPGPVPPATISLVLTPGLVRGGDGTKKLSITSSTSLIRLDLQLLGDDYSGYSAVLHNDEGAEVYIVNMLKARSTGGGKVVRALLPAETISQGDYYMQLSGITAGGDIEGIGKYFFRAIRN